MVMTIAKITAGDGYTYLTRHVANGDAGTEGRRSATAYYTAQGNPPGHWTGRGVHLIGLDGQQVTEEQMRALFGQGEHPERRRHGRRLPPRARPRRHDGTAARAA